MKTEKLVLSSLFIALAIVLPLITMQIPQLGQMLIPMHFPVIIAGIFLGPFYGSLVGLISPIIRMIIFGLPQFSMAICMSFELFTYGLVVGLFRDRLNIYFNLCITLIIGRLIYTFVAMIILKTPFLPTLIATFSSALIGIIIMFIIIPRLVKKI